MHERFALNLLIMSKRYRSLTSLQHVTFWLDYSLKRTARKALGCCLRCFPTKHVCSCCFMGDMFAHSGLHACAAFDTVSSDWPSLHLNFNVGQSMIYSCAVKLIGFSSLLSALWWLSLPTRPDSIAVEMTMKFPRLTRGTRMTLIGIFFKFPVMRFAMFDCFEDWKRCC